MKAVNALTIRQSLGRVLDELKRDGRPILVEKDRKPAAVLISLADYQRRFVDRIADEERRKIVTAIETSNHRFPGKTRAIDVIRELREGKR